MLGSRCTRSVAKSWQNLGTNTFCQAVLEPVCTLHPPVSPISCVLCFSLASPSPPICSQFKESPLSCVICQVVEQHLTSSASCLFVSLLSLPLISFSLLPCLLFSLRDLITFLSLLFQCAEEHQWSSSPLPLWLPLFLFPSDISISVCSECAPHPWVPLLGPLC